MFVMYFLKMKLGHLFHESRIPQVMISLVSILLFPNCEVLSELN